MHTQPGYAKGGIETPVIPADVCKVVRIVNSRRKKYRFNKLEVEIACLPIKNGHDRRRLTVLG
jgi:hypothetical protein